MTQFADLGLSPEVLKAVSDTGYDTATPIQAQAIPIALQGRDVLGIAQTGTGKTAAFTLPMIDRLAAGRSKARMPRSLVIAPTRELADQVASSFEKYAKYQKLSWALLIGGVSFDDQTAKLDRGVDVLIATPGRLLDHFERGKLLLTGVQIMVVDEADRMLDMGFIPDIERIFKLTPPKKQTLFFSATMPPEITRLTKQFLNNPERIEASRPAMTAETIAQHVARIPSSDPKAKRTALRMLIERSDVKNGIVFCNRKSEVDIVAKSLKVHGFDAAPIHGDLDQSVRMKTLADFRKGDLKILVASDVAARGLDIPDVSHVFNYDVPHHADDYVHRIGRTGRAGRKGEAFMIVTPADAKNFDKVLKLTKSVPDEVALDADWGSIKSEDRPRRGDRKDGRGGRGRDRERDRDRDRPRRAEPEARKAEPARAEPEPREAPEAEAVEARPSRSRRGERGGERGDRAERPERAERAERPERPERAERAERPERRERAEPVEQHREEPRRAELRREDRRRDEAGEPRREQPRRAEPVRRAEPERRGGRRDREDREMVGFGSDTPAFLLRAAPLKKAEPED
jgi:superfamily II DNA/RNA helicase